MDREKVIKGLECHADRTNMSCNIAKCPYYELDFCGVRLSQDALVLLKEQEAMNVDAFVQWCIDSHIMGDTTVRGIKYWVGEYKKTKEGR